MLTSVHARSADHRFGGAGRPTLSGGRERLRLLLDGVAAGLFHNRAAPVAGSAADRRPGDGADWTQHQPNDAAHCTDPRQAGQRQGFSAAMLLAITNTEQPTLSLADSLATLLCQHTHAHTPECEFREPSAGWGWVWKEGGRRLARGADPQPASLVLHSALLLVLGECLEPILRETHRSNARAAAGRRAIRSERSRPSPRQLEIVRGEAAQAGTLRVSSLQGLGCGRGRDGGGSPRAPQWSSRSEPRLAQRAPAASRQSPRGLRRRQYARGGGGI